MRTVQTEVAGAVSAPDDVDVSSGTSMGMRMWLTWTVLLATSLTLMATFSARTLILVVSALYAYVFNLFH